MARAYSSVQSQQPYVEDYKDKQTYHVRQGDSWFDEWDDRKPTNYQYDSRPQSRKPSYSRRQDGVHDRREIDKPVSILKKSGRGPLYSDYNDGASVQPINGRLYRTDEFVSSSGARVSGLADRKPPVESCATCASVPRQLDVFNSNFAAHYEDRHRDLLDEVDRRNGKSRARIESLQKSLDNVDLSVSACWDRDAELLARIKALEETNEAVLRRSRKLEGKIRDLESYNRDLTDELVFLSDSMQSTSHLNIDYSGPKVPEITIRFDEEDDLDEVNGHDDRGETARPSFAPRSYERPKTPTVKGRATTFSEPDDYPPSKRSMQEPPTSRQGFPDARSNFGVPSAYTMRA